MGVSVKPTMKGFGAKTGKGGRRYSAISASGNDPAVGVTSFKGKSMCIVFYHRKSVFTLGVEAFAEAQEKFNQQNCVVIACTADSSWCTWSTSLGLTLRGEITSCQSPEDQGGGIHTGPHLLRHPGRLHRYAG